MKQVGFLSEVQVGKYPFETVIQVVSFISLNESVSKDKKIPAADYSFFSFSFLNDGS